MASSGPNFPSVATNDTTVGTRTWTNPSYITSSNNVWSTASAAPFTSTVTNYLKATSFGFAIPSGATINGVEVIFEGFTSLSGGSYGSTYSVKLVKGGTISGTDKSTGQLLGGYSDVTVTYGGPSDLWGLTLTDTDVNDSTFGVVFSEILFAEKMGATGYCDSISIKIYYTVGGGGGWTDATSLLLAGD